jgi:hypothetical protein
MATKRASARSRYGQIFAKGDGPVQGKEQVHIDQRTAYAPMEDPKTMSKEALLIENEMLRETLYANQGAQYNRTIDLLNQHTGHSTSQIIKMAEAIERDTQGNLKAQDAFRIVYATMYNMDAFSFDDRKHNESKLQFAWRMGALPTVSMLMHQLLAVVSNLTRMEPVITRKYFRDLVNAHTARQKKLNKKP